MTSWLVLTFLEGLDLPEVSLVVILDADKEGFLRQRHLLSKLLEELQGMLTEESYNVC